MTAALFGELTQDGQQIVLVAEGDEHELSQVAAQLAMLTPKLAPVDANGQPVTARDRNAEIAAVLVPATWATVVQLGYSFNGFPGFSWEPQPRLNDWIIAETIRRTSQVPPLPDDLLPPWVQRTPRQYQLDGAAMIAAEGKFLLLDEPGTGKTACTLLGLEARRQAGTGIFPLVIVVPSWEVGTVWAEEIAAWELDWPAIVMHKGTGRGERLSGHDAFITTYATLRRDAADMRGPLVRLAPAAVIADEIHLARNGQSHQSLALRRIAKHAATVVGLSGTAITRNTGDVHPMLEATDPASWPSRDRMVKRYCARIEEEYGERITGLNPAAAPEFFAILDRNMRRVAKADVLKELPPKIYSVRKPDIPDEWMKAYRAMEEDMLAELPDGTELAVMDTLTKLTRLSQLASSAADVEIIEEPDPRTGDLVKRYLVTLKAPSWKAESLLGILAERPGQGVAVFMDSRPLALITGNDYLAPAGYRYGYVIGKGGGITDRTRQQAVSDFQAGKLDVIICTAGAGGLGITLTRAGTVVMLQRSWQYDLAIQPEDRAQRIGAGQFSDHIEVIDIVARGTVDQRRREVLRGKAGQYSEFARDPRIVRELLGGIR